jgi:hypothetical protein
LTQKPGPPLQAIVRYLRNLLPTIGSGETLLIVAIDDVDEATLGAVTLADRLTAEGKTVVLTDLTENRSVAHIFGVTREGRHQVSTGDEAREMLLVVPGASHAWDDEPVAASTPQWSNPDVVVVVASINPAVGAWHLLRWASRAVTVVTAGRSNAQRINGTAELLRAASISVTSAILVGADSHDDSIGLFDSGESLLEQPPGILRQPSPPTWP